MFSKLLIKFLIKYKVIKSIGDWGLGIGDWGLGIWGLAQIPIPKPQFPTPHPHAYIILLI